MRIASLLMVVAMLAGCGGYHTTPEGGLQTSSGVPTASGGDYLRDGFYDGGVHDPDQTARAIWLPE